MNRRSLLAGLGVVPLAALIPSAVESAMVADAPDDVFRISTCSDERMMVSIDLGAQDTTSWVWMQRRVGETSWMVWREYRQPTAA